MSNSRYLSTICVQFRKGAEHSYNIGYLNGKRYQLIF